MLENAVDAGATEIVLNIRDAGKELIQVIDNGCGMSATDARMSFERHATSKIRSIEDLFKIRTMGFRGEALASIAAVAKVEMKTRRHEEDTGTRICIEASEVTCLEPCAAPPGTNLMIKNLFYNIPARRHFLKSNTTELKHIWEEFTRIALANPHVAFRFRHNGEEQKHVEAGNLKTRVIGLLGHNHEKNLVPVEETTDLLRIHGFIGKPESAAKTRGMQFFFINNRYIRNAYLHHAVQAAFEGLLPRDAFPFYLLMLETDPARVDVNVHPTKQEVKFDDDRMIYAYLNAAVKHALARYNIAPSLDFTLNPEITQLPSVNLPPSGDRDSQAQKGYLYHSFSQKHQAHLIDPGNSVQRWKDLYKIAQEQEQRTFPLPHNPALFPEPSAEPAAEAESKQLVLLVQGAYLLTTVKSGLILIHVRRAQERISYERIKDRPGAVAGQKLVFPVTSEQSPADAVLLKELLPDLQQAGFDISEFGQQTFVIHAIPSGISPGKEKEVLDAVLEHVKQQGDAARTQEERSERISAQLARRMAQFTTPVVTPEQQQALIDELFSCRMPEYTPDGKKVFTLIKKDMLDSLL